MTFGIIAMIPSSLMHREVSIYEEAKILPCTYDGEKPEYCKDDGNYYKLTIKNRNGLKDILVLRAKAEKIENETPLLKHYRVLYVPKGYFSFLTYLGLIICTEDRWEICFPGATNE